MNDTIWNRNFICVLVVNFIMAAGFNAIIPTLPIYLKHQLDFSSGDIGLILSCFPITALAVRPLTGYLLDNFNRYIVYLVSILFMSIFFSAYVIPITVAGMVLVRLAHGAVWGGVSSAAATIATDSIPAKKLGEGIGIFALTMPLGMAIGPLAGSLIMTNFGADAMFHSAMAVSFMALVLGLFNRKRYAGRPTKNGFSIKKVIFAKAVPVVIVMFMASIPYGAIMVFSGIFAMERKLGSIGIFFSCFAFAILVSRLILGRMFDRGHAGRLVGGGLTLISIGLLLLGDSLSALQFYSSALVLGFGYGTIMPTCQAMVNNMALKRQRGAANSTYLISLDLGIGGGIFLCGFLAEHFALGTVYNIMPVFLLLSAATFFFWSSKIYEKNIVEDFGE